MKIDFAFSTVAEMICFLLVLTTKYSHIFSTTKICTKVGRAGSGPEFNVNFGSGRVGSGFFHLWVGLGRVKKIGPTSNSDRTLIL